MTMRIALLIVGSFVLSIAVVVALLALSNDIRERPGSFLRQYPPHPVIESKKVELPGEHYYFAGATSGEIYLANTTRPLEILAINSDMSGTRMAQLNFGIPERLEYFRITVKIDSPYYYFMDGAIPFMYRGRISDWSGEPFMTDSTYFIDALPISSRSFAICALSSKTREKALGKLIVNADVMLNHEVLQRQFDGVFDVDGTYSYSKEINRLVYVYFYRNQFMVMDTNLNLEYRASTIDTFRTARVKTAEISSEKSIKLSAPPIITNKSHAVFGEWLFIHSLLPAKNEDMEQFNKASTIDVYDLTSGDYQFSFYLFDEDGEKIKSMIVTNKKLYALYKHSIRQFEFVEKYFQEKP